RVRVGEREAEGRGSILLSDVWAWPDAKLSHETRDGFMRQTTQSIAGLLPHFCGEPAHPLELGLRLHQRAMSADHMPPLACAVCASPFDAAIHDAAGIATNKSAFDCYNES